MTEPAPWARARRRLTGRTAAQTSPPAPDAGKGGGPVERIMASGLFDRAYYELQVGRAFDSEIAAIKHYQQLGRRSGLSAHPLFECEWFLFGELRNRATSILAYLDDSAPVHGPGPLFDEVAYLARVPEAATHPGRALGHFLENASDDDLLPVPADYRGPAPTWREARELAYAAARDHARFEDLRLTPRRGPWDTADDAAFVETWLNHALPHREDDGSPWVSVVMPVRNRPVQVLEAIASIQAQTLPGWELIVVDDGSTDDTGAVLDRAAAGDDRIRVVHLPPSGVSAARNAGLRAATGRWLAFLDSDNTWVPHFLQVMVAYLEANDLEAGHAVVDTMIDPTPELGRYLNLDADLEYLLVRNHIDLNALMVRAEHGVEIGGFDETLRRWVDHDFAIRIARRTRIPRVSFVGVLYDHSFESNDRITATEADRWEWVVLGKALLDWDAAASAPRVAGRVSICMATVEDWERTRVAVDAVLAAHAAAQADDDHGDLELVLLVNGSRRSVGTILRVLYAHEPRVRIISMPRNVGFGIGASAAFLESTGETVVFLDNDSEVLTGWLEPLLVALDDDQVLGAQPLLLSDDGTVWSAGFAFLGGALVPSRLLAGHPVDDVVRLAPLRRTAVAGNALAMRAADFIRLRGFDPAFHNGLDDVDLCLRAGAGARERFLVVAESRVVHHCRKIRMNRYRESDQENRIALLDRWADDMPVADVEVLSRLGLRIAHVDPGEPVDNVGDVRVPHPVVTRPRSQVESGPGCGLPSLRWALKTGISMRAPDDAPDLIVAAALATSLRTLGQDVVVDRLESNGRDSDYLDDVAVAIRGEIPLIEVPGRVNCLWTLDASEPISEQERGRYDVVAGLSDVGGDFDRAARLLVDKAVATLAKAPWAQV